MVIQSQLLLVLFTLKFSQSIGNLQCNSTCILIDNIYVCVDGSVFQCVGIPMGTDAPVVANLFLFAYEYKFMKGLLKDNITLVIKFSNTYRYIKDLLCIY